MKPTDFSKCSLTLCLGLRDNWSELMPPRSRASGTHSICDLTLCPWRRIGVQRSTNVSVDLNFRRRVERGDLPRRRRKPCTPSAVVIFYFSLP